MNGSELSILDNGDWITLGEIISSSTHTEVDNYRCIVSNEINLPRQTTTKMEVVLTPNVKSTLQNEPRQKFRALGLEIDAMVTHQDLSFGMYGVGLTMEWIVLDSKDIGNAEVALQSCLDTMEFNEDLL